MIQVFKGVRYARAPRFGQPVLTGLDLDEARSIAAPQPPIYGFSYLTMNLDDDTETGEDCLRLTVYTPGTSGKRPVLVWIHGGAFIGGSGMDSWYDGTALAEEGDLVVVCVSYRLGALGFLYEPERSVQNLGIQDQCAALRWIRKHIGAFGGDPDRITVAGQSAGAYSIGCLISETREELFRKAILMSSPYFPLPRPVMRRVARVFRTCLHSDPATASVHKLLRAQLVTARKTRLPLPFAPCGYSVTRPRRVIPGLREVWLTCMADDALAWCPIRGLVPLVTRIVFSRPMHRYAGRLRRMGVATQETVLRWLHGTTLPGDVHGLDFALLFGDWERWKDQPMAQGLTREAYDTRARLLRRRVISFVKG